MDAFGRTLLAAALVLAGIVWCEDANAAGECGQPTSTGAGSTATDSRYALLAAIGARFCDPCICDVDGSGSIAATDSLAILNVSIGIAAPLACPPCDESAQCPGVAQFALFAKIRGACATNDDCGGVGFCDSTIGRCHTATRLDIGWTGLAHSQDLDDIVPARLLLDCQGPAPCGECPITGLDPQLGNCRCANDNRTICFQTHEPDPVSCGGEVCNCYFGPPVPLSAGNVPTCLLNTVEDDIGGTVNVDAGTGSIAIPLLERVYLGISLLQPCPICENDPVPADGRRGGTCKGGLQDGQTCDAQSANTTFPAPGGARHSLDCFPDPDISITPSGLSVPMVLSTGTTSIAASVPCGLLGQDTCPCASCSGDPLIACSSDDECAAAQAGTCSRTASLVVPAPNACTGGACTDIGGTLGECSAGPVDSYCDGIVRADGRGLIGCNVDADCAPASIGVDAGACTLEEPRACYLDPLVATGRPHPVLPVGAAVFCTPATSSSGVNNVTGLPGPTRWEQEALLTLFCANAPLATYQPGVGGCP